MRALDVLELDSDADFEAVKKSWRRLAKENHPDVKPGDANAAVRFQAIQAAYEVLKTAEERREWRPNYREQFLPVGRTSFWSVVNAQKDRAAASASRAARRWPRRSATSLALQSDVRTRT